MGIVINWQIEVVEEYSITVDEADALEQWGTIDPNEIKELIEDNVDDFLPGEETEETSVSATVNERKLDSVDTA